MLVFYRRLAQALVPVRVILHQLLHPPLINYVIPFSTTSLQEGQEQTLVLNTSVVNLSDHVLTDGELSKGLNFIPCYNWKDYTVAVNRDLKIFHR